METKITRIIESEYANYFTIELEVNGNRFLSLAVFSKSQIRNNFNLSDEEFEDFKK